MANKGLTAGNSQITDDHNMMTPQFRQFLVELIASIGLTGFSLPTGTPSNASIDANWTTTVSNPPTQAEVIAIRDQVIAIQKGLAQVILDLSE